MYIYIPSHDDEPTPKYYFWKVLETKFKVNLIN